MRKLLALLSALASPALAQTPAGVINAPIYATGYISQVGGTNVTTSIPPQPNHPTNLNIYTTGAISGTWTIKLPNPAFEGQVLSFNCSAAANAISITSSDGSSVDPNLPTSCGTNAGFATQFDQRSNIWRSLGANNLSTFKPFAGVTSYWAWQLNADGSWTTKRPDATDITFTQTGTGAIGRTVFSMLDDWRSAQGYTTFSAAVTALGSTFGATLSVPKGSYSFAAGLTLANSQSIAALAADLPLITFTGTTGTALTIKSNHSTLSNLYLYGQNAGTYAGIAIGAGEQGRSPYLNNLTIDGLFDPAINGVSNTYRQLYNVNVNTTGTTGIVWQNTFNPDAGDDYWAGVTISGPTQDLVRYTSGGGLKLSGFKGLGAVNGINLYVDNGIVTQDFIMVGSSIENSSSACVSLSSPGTGIFYNVVLVGNQFYNCPNGINVIGAATPSGIISGNTFSSIGSGPIILGNGASNWTVGRNNYVDTMPIDNRNDFNIQGGGIDWHVVRGGLNTSSTTPTIFDEIQFHSSGNANFESARIKVFIQGLVQGCGAAAHHEEGILTNDAGTIAYTTIKSQDAGPCLVTFGVNTATAYKAFLTYAKSSGTQFLGTATLDVDGSIKTIIGH